MIDIDRESITHACKFMFQIRSEILTNNYSADMLGYVKSSEGGWLMN